ncbi:hypothetical protein EDD15DRAFT_2375143 [Pisolithus albus]|nr:hypothetical protein EDD15DRAFT_2375143 [Pisolithus albus]
MLSQGTSADVPGMTLVQGAFSLNVLEKLFSLNAYKKGLPETLKKIASELLPSPPPARSPHWSPKRSFTPDSFAASEEFDIVNTQLLRERWAQIREDLVAGQECRRPIFSEVTTPTPPQICLSIVVLARDDIYRLLRLPGFVGLDSVSAITLGNKLFIASTEI